MAKKLLNTKGAASHLGCSENWIHKLVYAGKIKAYIYDEAGELVERPVGSKRQGAALYFYESDLNKYKAPKLQTRPKTGRRYTDEQRQEALRLDAQHMSHREIAQRIGVSRQTINNWVK
jgi:predicted DNA-binding transcriptional regulator AlpA